MMSILLLLLNTFMKNLSTTKCIDLISDCVWKNPHTPVCETAPLAYHWTFI